MWDFGTLSITYLWFQYLEVTFSGYNARSYTIMSKKEFPLTYQTLFFVLIYISRRCITVPPTPLKKVTFIQAILMELAHGAVALIAHHLRTNQGDMRVIDNIVKTAA